VSGQSLTMAYGQKKVKKQFPDLAKLQ